MAHHVKQPACANCHYAFPAEGPDEFCPRCGQQNHDVNLNFGHVLEEGLEGIFHFDSKVFSTLGLLLFKPGQLTKRFLAGHRVPYVPPIRLYVFISFVFFLLLSLQGGHGGRKSMREEIAENQEKAEATGQATHVEVLPGIIMDTKPDSAALGRAARRLAQQAQPGDQPAAEKPAGGSAKHKEQEGAAPRKYKVTLLGFDLSNIDFARLPEELRATQVDSLIRGAGGKPSFVTRLAVRRAARWHDVTREELMHQLLRGMSIMMFLLMPLAALLLKGVYFRQRRYYISHLIFTVHMHCFAFILLAVSMLISKVTRLSGLEDWLVVAAVVYFVVAIHTFYEQSWGRTLAKSVLLGLSYLLVLTFSGTAVMLLGALAF